jgi:hypothetical protein
MGLGTTVFFSLSGATVTVTLKAVPVEVSLQGTALAATTTVGAYVPYREVVTEGVEEVLLESEGEKRVERKASGTIIVYNNFGSAPQRLIKNTRFETPDGFMYRIPESIIVPGRKTDGGKTLPGSVETPVFADQAGDTYNIGLTDFTIPGFKTSPERFAGFYARSKTEMTGGFVGMAPFVSPEKLANARSALRAALQSTLLTKARAEAGEDLVFDSGFALRTASVPEEAVSGGKMKVVERGTLTAFAFSRRTLAAYIAERSLLRYDGAAVILEGLDTLSFGFLNKVDYGKGAGGTLLFDIQGKGTVVWELDEAALARSLAGKPKTETVAVVSSFPAIERSQVIIRPFWKKAFPSNPERIIIKVSH